ncbi:MAG: hypothetical protein ACJ71N_12670 [Terriglobales bacterium]|jgi:hypothetical protein
MNCAEFQKDLPEIIEGGGSEEQKKHLASCPVCADLVQDLKYIAEQAKLLVPMEDPSPKVWDGIEKSLKQEGLWPAHGGPADPRPFLVPQRSRLAWPMMAAAAAIVVAIVAGYYSRNTAPPAVTMGNSMVASSGTLEPDDQQLIRSVSTRGDAATNSYRKNLEDVNAYIADAKKWVDAHPDDLDARDALMRANEQKQLLYEMATQDWQ